MKKILAISMMTLCSMMGYSQNYSKTDSIFIYKNLLMYDTVNDVYDDIRLDVIWEYHDSIPSEAEYYYHKSTFIRSIPAWQRVLMISYLPSLQKKDCLIWVYKHLDMRNEDEVAVFFHAVQWNDFFCGFSFSELGIPPEVVQKYCPNCKYK